MVISRARVDSMISYRRKLSVVTEGVAVTSCVETAESCVFFILIASV